MYTPCCIISNLYNAASLLNVTVAWKHMMVLPTSVWFLGNSWSLADSRDLQVLHGKSEVFAVCCVA